MSLKIVCISDTHNLHNKIVIPECDILIHSGDATSMGYEREVRAFSKWLNNQDAGHIIFVPGNHELSFERCLPGSREWFQEECPTGIMLIDEAIEIEGIKIYGSPVQPEFFNWAFNRARTLEEAQHKQIKEIKPHWNAIPADTNILITHGPPSGILDSTLSGESVGCKDLLYRIKEIKPDIHIFGHIHLHGGKEEHIDGTSFYNAAVCDERYQPSNKITVIDYE